ncbi:MAG: hypothetical protein ACRD0K_21700 [Egibacteraceae bacterium]
MTANGASEVRVTSRRIVLTPPCCPHAVIGLARAGRDLAPLTDHPVVCPACRERWTVAFLAERRWGLRARWTPQSGDRPNP